MCSLGIHAKHKSEKKNGDKRKNILSEFFHSLAVLSFAIEKYSLSENYRKLRWLPAGVIDVFFFTK